VPVGGAGVSEGIRELHRSEIEPHIPLLLSEGFTPEIDQGTWLGWFSSGALAGWVRVFREGDEWMLEDVYVLPEHREQGIAAALIDAARRGRDPLWLICDDEMLPFYERLGFAVAAKEDFPEPLATLYAAKREWPAASDHNHNALRWSGAQGARRGGDPDRTVESGTRPAFSVRRGGKLDAPHTV
jgi:GNAT superfamily N-acetyltransferase